MPTLHEFELGNVLWRTRGLTAYRATHRTRGEGLLAIHWQSGRRIVAREADPLWREAHVAERLGGEVPDAFLEYRREGTDSWGLAPWFAGVPLGPTEASATPELLDTLEIGAQCARYLDRIHALGGRHGSLTPQGILWCPETRTVRLADRGFASLPELPDIEARESDRE